MTRKFLFSSIYGAGLGVVLAFALHFASILGTANLRTVLPGLVYRSAQPRGATLDRLVRRHGIRTVINLRGCSPHLDWYRDESRHTAELDLDQEDVVFSASRMPSPQSVRHLVAVFDRARYPVLLHCHQGVDRTGLAAVMVLLLHTHTPLPEARRQMSLEMGHVRLGRTRFIGRLFDQYERWLAGLSLTHSPGVFRAWATKHYCPAEARSEWELVGPGTDIPAYAVTMMHVKAHNRSPGSWHFRADRNAGIHAYAYLDDAQGRRVWADVAGRFDVDVGPGEAVALRLSLPGLAPGRYSLVVELIDEPHASFTQLGDAPLALDLTVS